MVTSVDKAPEKRLGMVTPKELQVLTLLCTEGMSNKQLAERLGMSENTARAHIRALMNKTGTSNRLGLVVFMLHNGGVESLAEQYHRAAVDKLEVLRDEFQRMVNKLVAL